MNLPLYAGLFGAASSIVFLFNAARELKRDEEGHARNAAMIHVAMGSMFLPACLIIIAVSVL